MLSARIVPPCAVTISLTMASPNPRLPSFDRVRDFST
jgi:hypothetical protein